MLDRREARKRYQETFSTFMAAYPRRVDHTRAFEEFLVLVLDEGYDPSDLIAKAASYSRNVDPDNLQYVPSPRTWLRDRRFNDEDLFTDKRVSAREWLVRAYREADAAAVERKYGYVYPDPPVPDGVTDLIAWCRDDRKKWISGIANHILNGAPLPD